MYVVELIIHLPAALNKLSPNYACVLRLLPPPLFFNLFIKEICRSTFSVLTFFVLSLFIFEHNFRRLFN